jgi:excisionase family DNA binding protein
MEATDDPGHGADAMNLDRIAYTIKDAARLLSLSARTVRYMVETGELRSIKVGRARRVHGSAIAEYAAKHTEPGCRERAS